MSRQAKRTPLKRPKDLKQGRVLLDSMNSAMPQYPLDPDFEQSLPEELAGLYDEWQTQRRA
jgi:hypothetical protein